MQINNWLVAVATALGAATAIAAHGADSSTDRTSMPDSCSERDVNCVIPDGEYSRIAPRTILTPPAGTTGSTTPGSSTSGAGISGAGKGTGGSMGGSGGNAAGSGSGGFGGR
jgi:hypothetical protein